MRAKLTQGKTWHGSCCGGGGGLLSYTAATEGGCLCDVREIYRNAECCVIDISEPANELIGGSLKKRRAAVQIKEEREHRETRTQL